MTRYCGYCGKPGHNRRTCPDRPQEYKDNDKVWMNKPGRKKGSKTICSYCGVAGHNRRTCPHLKERKSIAIGAVDTSIKKSLEVLVEHGLGIGAMYERKSPWYRNDRSTYVVTGEGIGVEYKESQYKIHYDDHFDWSEYRVPTFVLSLQSKFLYGTDDTRRWDDSTINFPTYYDPKQSRLFADSTLVRQFGTDTDNCITWLGKSGTAFGGKLESLRKRLLECIDDFYRDKGNVHPYYGRFNELGQLEG